MCGFVGLIGAENVSQTELEKMGSLITHRGPDDTRYYSDDICKFVFKRLSIIDLEGGHQPLSYENERYWIIFNGEIYNYVELREQLIQEGYTFQTSSDTETIIAMYSAKGKEVVQHLRGMFAFIIWDKEKKEAFGARDHFGIKPFFYREEGDSVYCSSESKSLMYLDKTTKVNNGSLQHYMTYQYVPEPNTIAEGIKKLEPGSYFTKKMNEPMEIKKYWQPTFKPVNSDFEEKKKLILETMKESVGIHMRSDVPVGSFLSGGIDSSCVVALAKQLNPKIKTFTVGFERNGFSEVDVAKETAEKLGVENISYTITPDEYIKELPKIIWHMDEPLADPAAIPLYFVAREARKHVKVVLSGEGADELFGGYNIYREPQSLRGFSYLPHKGKDILKLITQKFPDVKGKSFVERGCTPIEERYFGNAKIMTEFQKSMLLKQYDPTNKYTNVTAPIYARVKDYHDIEKMQYIDMHTWLRGDILVKADKMTMANSLELRVPFLDKKVFDVASTLTIGDKVTKHTTKLALREAMREVVPEHVLMRRKLGFPVPIRHWLKDEIHDWAMNLIQESNTDYLINKNYVLQLMESHCQGKGDFSRKIWTVLCFMLWHQIFVEGKYDFNQGKESKSLVYV
ncbi:asparagine synthase (glutamine-hydrolyzing) [Alkalihalobacillus sp. MEB130]|uniref:asparagine synthase (glutamine-hydrolyzing) n=1 Tax=Alkalihalobacillus sp. MEB130 TaxID=2976704 RepID=UPI0028DD6FDB|nr:asparagine synthase (glutamine-hydrolyzing) [Alkalihalobacillus sp. MEB130]MDT8858896.1 asparagine synthase (glutamine-hydrolyzing) [Alkalihalobacillus sp. MEB130]